MKTLLYTGYDKAYEPLAQITGPRMDKYAEKHGMDFKCYTEPLIDVPNGIYWTGVCGALKAFKEGYERVVYLDVDQLVTNYEYKLPDFVSGFHVSKDWGEDAIEPWQFSMCGFIAHRLEIESIFQYILSLEPEWRDKPFPEQGPVQHVFKDRFMALNAIGSYDHDLFLWPRKIFNCVPDQVCPGKVPKPWAPGDWCAHLTMLPINERIDLAHHILLLCTLPSK